MKDEFLQNDLSRRAMKNLSAFPFVPPQMLLKSSLEFKDVLGGQKYSQFDSFIRYIFLLGMIHFFRRENFLGRTMGGNRSLSYTGVELVFTSRFSYE